MFGDRVHGRGPLGRSAVREVLVCVRARRRRRHFRVDPCLLVLSVHVIIVHARRININSSNDADRAGARMRGRPRVERSNRYRCNRPQSGGKIFRVYFAAQWERA